MNDNEQKKRNNKTKNRYETYLQKFAIESEDKLLGLVKGRPISLII